MRAHQLQNMQLVIPLLIGKDTDFLWEFNELILLTAESHACKKCRSHGWEKTCGGERGGGGVVVTRGFRIV
jgi:hypothetical protein